MQAIVKTEAKPGAEIQRVAVPEIGSRDVLVRVKAASVCGTDLHIYRWDRWSERRIHPPLVFGHEFCGVVESVGAEVTTARAGDFVSAEMHVACGRCFQCRTGQGHICQNVRITGIDMDGCFAELVKIPESNIWKIDPAIPVDYAAVLDPLGNAVHTVLAGEIAGPIFASEPHPYRIKLAEKMGATAGHRLLPDRSGSGSAGPDRRCGR